MEESPRWYELSVSGDVSVDSVMQNVVTPCDKLKAPYYIYGSLYVSLTPARAHEFATRFSWLTLRETPIEGRFRPVVDNSWDHPPWVYAMALDKKQLVSNETFLSQFRMLFRLNADGALLVEKSAHEKITIFAVRFASIVRAYSGIWTIVPRFGESLYQNEVEMLLLFASVYPAYLTLSRNLRWPDEFHWCHKVEATDA